MYLNNYQVNVCIMTTQSENIARTFLNYVTTFVPREKVTTVNFTVIHPAFLDNFTTIIYLYII